MKAKILLVVVLGIVIYSCAPKIVPTDKEKTVENNDVVTVISKEENTKTKDIVLTSDQADGKRMYEINCAKCHDLYAITDFKPEEWEPILKRMQPKANISDEERIKIYNYVTMN